MNKSRKPSSRLRNLGIPILGCLFLTLSLEAGEVSTHQSRYQYTTPPPPDSLSIQTAKTQIETAEDLTSRKLFSLRLPSNVRTTFVYDPKSNLYLLTTYLGDKILGTPIPYTPSEYLAYISRERQYRYFQSLGKDTKEKTQQKGFNPFDLQFDLGAVEQIFGPGGIRLRLQGTAEISAGLKTNSINNPALSEQARNRSFFDFNEKIQARVQASVGDKLNFNLNYNTASTFDFDAHKLKLAFEGKEDDIIKLIEAGNVSMSPRNSLINGGGSLFGIHSKMQFGRLTLDMLVSQQRTQTKRLSTQGGVQTKLFEISASDFDEQRHFFLGDFFRQQYNEAMKSLPYVRSSVQINRVEVWITNRRGKFDESRNVVAFADLGEAQRIHNSTISLSNEGSYQPRNNANSLYSQLLALPNLRQGEQVSRLLSATMSAGTDYERIESARRLQESEYTLNPALGYISLNTKLASDEVLAVSYEYTYKGSLYQVGEFSADRPDQTSGNLYVKLLKGTDLSPSAPYWDYMMRNVYSLGSAVSGVTANGFKLDITYRSDSTGTATPYLPAGTLSGKRLLGVLGLDKLNQNQQAYPDGRFDFVEGYTINTAKGLIYFPTIEPFGQTLSAQMTSQEASRFAFPELYNRTLVEAKQRAEKNKYTLRGEYRSSSGGGEISLGALNVTPGTVRVTAGGVTLTENSDYTVDYLAGVVKIINTSILEARTPVEVSLEDGGGISSQRKTMLGLDMNYKFNKHLTMGATLMHLSELPLTNKTALGEESMRNTLWGLNLSYQSQSPWLTNLLNKLPLLNLSKPSSLSLDAEFAHLIPGHYESRYTQGSSYLDDFESSRSEIDLLGAYAWTLSSPPATSSGQPQTEEDYLRLSGGRAHLAWFQIDPLFTRERSTLSPSYIRNNPDYVSNHFVREVAVRELFPYKDQNLNQLSYIPTLNLSYYPKERGPYNLSADRLGSDGFLLRPQESWGGIMRRLNQTDFETTNIEYLEFWLMDPFVYGDAGTGGDLVFHLGDISEDIIPDGKKSFENGLPINDDPAATEPSLWGRIPRLQSVGYAFDNSPDARAKQDVGLDGLSTDQEKSYPTYTTYLSSLRQRLSASTLSRWGQDSFSAVNDPAGDNFHHYLGNDYDDQHLPILERYKYYNGLEGNSSENNGNSTYSTAARLSPDVEDVNLDNSLNESNRYYEYRVSLRPSDLRVGTNSIVGERTAEVTLRNGQTSQVKWYQFKIPLSQPYSRVGSISDFRSIRFLRMLLTGFDERINVRFGALRLTRSDWRIYQQSLSSGSSSTASTAQITASAVNIEEHGDRRPVNYVLPPGVSRSLDAQQTQTTQQNEQAISLKVQQLSPNEAKAIYKNTNYDLRRYGRIQLFSHAEALVENLTNLADNDCSLFLRIGSDYQSNYYEYSVPLSLTPSGNYNSFLESDRSRVWPDQNYINLPLERLTSVKRERNERIARASAGTSYTIPYSVPDPERGQNTIVVMGNPSLSNVRTIMVGVRNRSGQTQSIEVWINELRVTDYHEEGGWAANANLGLQLSDLGSANLRGQFSTAGFGAIDQSLSQRQLNNRQSISISTNLDLGRLFPEQTKVTLPLYYTYSKDLVTPQYNPLDEDMKLKDALDATASRVQRDSILSFARTIRTNQGLSLSGVNVGIRSQKPMPYDPANFSLSYSRNTSSDQTPEMSYQRRLDWQAGLTYDYSPTFSPLRPFSSIGGSSSLARYLRQYGLRLWPNRINLQTQMIRNYEEEQLRSLTADEVPLPATFLQRFLWTRRLNLNWNITPNLTVQLNMGTDARIEEPHVQVNRSLNPDAYAVWRDSVWRSISELGTPIKFAQSIQASYTLPTAVITPINWLNTQVGYSSSYNWDMGAQLGDPSIRTANIIANQLSIDVSAQARLRSLYSKWDYLRRLEQRYNSTSPTKPTLKPQLRTLQRSVRLSADSAIRLTHGLGNRQLRIVAKDSLGRIVPISIRTLDPNTLELPRDSSRHQISLTITERRQVSERTLWDDLGERMLYSLLMVKDASISYRRSQSHYIPGFIPSIGAVGGQGRGAFSSAPGIPFALGLEGEDYVDRIADKGWLLMQGENIQPAVFSSSSVFDAKATLQPLRDLNIILSANHTHTQRIENRYMYAGHPRTYGGSFVMTTIGLRGFGERTSADEGYATPSFSRFLALRSTMAERIRERLPQHRAAQLDLNSPAVLIPAFRAAYTASGNATSLNPLPDILSLLPNWNITYNGLTKVAWLRKYFSNVSLRHAYRATYSIDSYTSFPSWQGNIGEGIGILPSDVSGLGGGDRISLPYDIASVSMQESFFPLLGVDLTLESGVGFTTQWRRSRGLVLSLAAARLIESNSNELNFGINYKIADFGSVLKALGGGNRRSRRARTAKTSSGRGLTIRADYSYRRTLNLIRRIEENFTQATAGNVDSRLSLTTEYDVSRLMTLRAYYEWTSNRPLVSTASFPIRNTALGISLRINLNQ